MNKLLSLLSLAVLLGTLYINYLAGTGGINNIATGQVSGNYPTLFTLAGFTFAIWSVIYLLNISFVVANLILVFSKPTIFQKKLITLFTVICLVNVCWIFSWHYDQILISVVFMLSLLALLIQAFRLSRESDASAFQSELARVNFAVYLGWISVATIANVSVSLSQNGATDWTGTQVIWTVVVIFVAVLLALWMLFRFQSFAYAMVIAWALNGIRKARLAEADAFADNVALAATVALMVVLVTGGYVFTRKLIRLRSQKLRPYS